MWNRGKINGEERRGEERRWRGEERRGEGEEMERRGAVEDDVKGDP